MGFFEVRFLDLELWQWLGLFLVAITAWLGSLLLAGTTVRLLGHLVTRSGRAFDERIVSGPVRLALAVLIFAFGRRYLALDLPAQEFLLGLVSGESSLYTTALTLAAIGGLARGVCVIYAFARSFLIRKRFVTFRFGWVEILVSPEPFILLGVAYSLFRGIESLSSPTTAQSIVAASGAALVLIGCAVVIWTVLSWTSIFAGHGVLEDHRLITRGAYAVVRHPVYVGAFLIWLGLALAFSNVLALVITVVYVIPVYILYLRAEESMMLESFGEEYRDYRSTVPMLLPFLGRGSTVGPE
jgi:protein-S-isoprenylcysteine O-methyltransferase Ste14